MTPFVTTLNNSSLFIKLIWVVVVLVALFAGFRGEWGTVFSSLLTVMLVFYTSHVDQNYDIHVPRVAVIAIVLFLVGSLFLGEVFDFYERFWFWDVLLHCISAAGFALIAGIYMIVLFGKESTNASPRVIAFFALCVAVAIGAVWEIFEFAMDQLFGLNMQKSGLVDTMWDLIIDTGGAMVAAISVYVYLVYKKPMDPLSEIIDEAVKGNSEG